MVQADLDVQLVIMYVPQHDHNIYTIYFSPRLIYDKSLLLYAVI